MISNSSVNNLICSLRKLIPVGCPVSVGCSGGADSMALLWACTKSGHKPRAYHIIHDMRDYSECIKDMKCIEKFCLDNNIDFTYIQINAKKEQQENGGNFEDICSKIRYNTMTEWCKRDNIKYLLTAHNADDQLETLIMKICRGTGVDGMQGILESQEMNGINVIRPMLNITKREVYDICKDKQIPWVEDITNNDTDYTRNAIRHNVLPLLKKVNPCASQNANKVASIMRDVNNIVKDRADYLKKIQSRDEDCIYISRISLIEEKDTVIYEWIKSSIIDLGINDCMISNKVFLSVMKSIRSNVGIKRDVPLFNVSVNLKEGVTINVHSKIVKVFKSK